MTSRVRHASKRVFHADWTHDYLFIPWDGKALCMVCSKIIAHIKVFNIRRHYNAFHRNTYDQVRGPIRLELVQRLRDDLPLVQERRKFAKRIDDSAAHQVAVKIANSNRSCQDGCFIKECMVAVAKVVAPDKVQLFEEIDLSESALRNKLQEVSENLGSRLSTISNDFICFSLCIDDYRDLSGTMQFIIFIRGVTKDLAIHEDFLGVVPVEQAASSQQFMDAIVCLLRYWCSVLPIQLLVGITSNKSFIVSDDENSVSSLLKSKACRPPLASEALPGDHTAENGVFVLHCFLHQISRCMQILSANDALEVAMKCIDLLRTSCSKQPTAAIDLIAQSEIGRLDHPEVGWIENVKILEPFLQLTDHIRDFINNNHLTVTTKDGADICNMLSDTAWLVDLAFLVDISRHIKTMFNCLTSNDQHISEVFFAIQDFKSKLSIFRTEIDDGDLTNFTCVSALMADNDFTPDFVKYGLMCKDLDESFSNSFKELGNSSTALHLFCNPFSTNLTTETTDPPGLVYELKLLQSNSILRRFFETLPLRDFYKELDQSCYPILLNNARFWIAQFSTTYICKRVHGTIEKRREKAMGSLKKNYLDAEFRLAMKSTETYRTT